MPLRFLICLVLLPWIVIAQSPVEGSMDLFKKNKLRYQEYWTAEGKEPFVFNAQLYGLTEHDSMRLLEVRDSHDNWERRRYRQYHKGLEVVGGTYILHYKDKEFRKASGSLYPNIVLDTEKNLIRELDTDKLQSQLNNSFKIAEYPIESDVVFDFELAELCIIDRTYPEFTGDYKLARKILASSVEGSQPINEEVYVDARTGDLIVHFSHVHFDRVKGVMNTKYYGEQEVYIDSIAHDKYLLKDDLKSVFTLNASKDTFENNSKYWNQYNEQQNEVAGDVHFGGSAFYDMMKDRFNWEGIDGEGGELTSLVHARGKYYVNAFWDGKKANFGNGDCDKYWPLTSLDIVGHEFVHGFTDHSSDLVYRNESGALNESISDIFGKALEYYYDRQNFNWLLGDRIRKNEDVNIFRSMEDPNFRYHPKYYGGTHWRTGSADNGGVHSNSGVFNYWFYLLVEGGYGSNEALVEYDVWPIGMDKALNIVFTLQTSYLTENSNYFDAMYYSLEVCRELYGADSEEMSSVLEAWNAVGLYPGIDDYDLRIEGDGELIALCADSIFYPKYLIRNVGRKMLMKGDSLYLQYKQANLDEVKEYTILDSDLMPGDSLVYVFDKAIVNEVDSEGQIVASLEFEADKSVINNEFRNDFRTSEIDGMDIELISVDFFPEEDCGESDLSRINFRLYNGGCKVIEEGDSIYFDVLTDKGDFSFARPVHFDNEPGVNYGSTTSIKYWDIPKDFTEYTIKFRHEDDVVDTNNSYESSVKRRSFVDKEYFQSFEDISSLDELDMSFNENYILDTLLDYQNNSVLAFSGLKSDIFYKNCEDVNDFFDQFSYKGNISICVDTREMDDPYFSFEHAEFRNPSLNVEITNPDFSSMLRVRLNDDEWNDLLIYAQNEGDIFHYEIPLLKDYVGLLEFEFISMAGESLLSNSSILDLSDLVMFDDFRLYERGEAFTNYNEEDFLIFPNPASDVVRFLSRSNDRVFGLKILNVLGQLVFSTEDIYNQYWLDVSGFQQGLYSVIFTVQGEIVSKDIFVVNRG